MERYGHVPPVVYFVQRRPDGPIKIGHAHRLAVRFEAFYRACPDPVIARAVVPGGQPLEHWFHRRHTPRSLFNEWYDQAESIVEDATRIADMHIAAHAECGDIAEAMRVVLRQVDPVIADVERLYRNGAPLVEIAKLAGGSRGEMNALVHKMRALGFEMKYRNARTSRSPRHARFPDGSRARLLG
jgi:hypothetical protein